MVSTVGNGRGCRPRLQVVSAPTGSGKTGVMELGLLRLLGKRMTADCGQLLLPHGSHKALYLAPMRALVQERMQVRVAAW